MLRHGWLANRAGWGWRGAVGWDDGRDSLSGRWVDRVLAPMPGGDGCGGRSGGGILPDRVMRVAVMRHAGGEGRGLGCRRERSCGQFVRCPRVYRGIPAQLFETTVGGYQCHSDCSNVVPEKAWWVRSRS
jgi:hypothetical protein